MVVAGRLDVEGGVSVALLWHQLRSAPCQRLPVQATEHTLVGSRHDRTTIASCAYVPIHTIALALTRVRPEGVRLLITTWGHPIRSTGSFRGEDEETTVRPGGQHE